MVASRRESVPREPKPGILLNDLFLKFVLEKLPTYSRDEQFCLKGAIKVARELHGETAAAEFGPIRLRTIREAMIRKGWSRGFINKQVKRLRAVLRWGVGWELIPQTLVDSLKAVEALSPGASDAPESRPRVAVPDANLHAVRAVLSDLNRDLFDLMLLTGARPGELLNLTTGQIDRSGDVWRATLAKHKTSHQGKSRTLFFNATAQAILQRHLTDNSAARVFKIRRDSFGAAIKQACQVAFGMPDELRRPGRNLTPQQRAAAMAWQRQHVWTPHWLRHTVATRLADEIGTEAAQRLLGHSTRAMTEHYSRAADRLAIEAAKVLG